MADANSGRGWGCRRGRGHGVDADEDEPLHRHRDQEDLKIAAMGRQIRELERQLGSNPWGFPTQRRNPRSGHEPDQPYQTLGMKADLPEFDGIKSALPLHGADQFDENDKKEAIQMSSFFQLAFVGCVSWWCNWGFFVSTLAMLFGAIIFCVGLPWYRIFVIKGTSAITEIFQVYVAAIRNRNLQLPEDSSDLYEIDEDEEAAIPAEFLPHTDTFNPTSDIFDSTRFHHGHKITNSFHIPPASLPIIPIAFLIIIIPVYDQIIIPILRKFTGIPTGITYLQRVRVGLVLSAISMAIASIIEVKCKHVAREHNMLDAVPMLQPLPISVFWLSIQVFIFGIADMFTYVGNY